MKTQTLKLLAVLLLLVTIGCTNDNLDSDLENLNKKEKLETKDGKNNDNQNARKGSSDPCITFNEMPDGTQYLVFPVDMNYQEQLMLNNPEVAGFNGNFEDFYREYMSNQFTIYNIQISQSCNGFERWTVNMAEYNAFEGTFNGLYTLDNDVNGGTGTTNNNNGTNSDPAGPIDINGNPIGGGTDDDDDDEDPVEIGLPSILSSGGIPYNCFVGACNLQFED